MIRKIRPVVLNLVCTGAFVGSAISCAVANRNVSIKFANQKQITFHNSLPLISCIGCAIAFPSILVLSPLIFIDYVGNTCVADRLIDYYDSKYLLKFDRYHQHDDTNNKYYSPSHLEITIEKKCKKSD